MEHLFRVTGESRAWSTCIIGHQSGFGGGALVKMMGSLWHSNLHSMTELVWNRSEKETVRRQMEQRDRGHGT